MTQGSISVQFLDELYARTSDPWDLANSPYEAAKYDATIRAIPRLEYQNGLEIGSSIGVLTAKLARKCRHLLAIDPAEAALEQAKLRNIDQSNVVFEKGVIPRDGLRGYFDLVVLSEVLYFMSVEDVRATAALIANHVNEGADLILVNWLPVSDLPLDGETAAREFIAAIGPRGKIYAQDRNEKYRLDVLRMN